MKSDCAEGHGEPFGTYKFRTMRPNADKEIATLLAVQGTSEKPLFKVENDEKPSASTCSTSCHTS